MKILVFTLFCTLTNLILCSDTLSYKERQRLAAEAGARSFVALCEKCKDSKDSAVCKKVSRACKPDMSKWDIDQKKYPELYRFVERYGLPRAFANPDKSPDLVYKGVGIDRIFNADQLRHYFKENKLDKLDAPYKYFSPAGIVFAEHIREGSSSENYTEEEAQQLNKFVKETGFCDFAPGNMITNKEGKIFIVDTEDMSFGCLTITGSNSFLNRITRYLKHLKDPTYIDRAELQRELFGSHVNSNDGWHQRWLVKKR